MNTQPQESAGTAAGGTSIGGPGQLTGAAAIARGVGRALADHGYGTMAEFPLRNGRRVDLIGLDAGGRFVIVEIKSSAADFRGDGKWPDYLDYCDAFYFAVGPAFPRHILPADRGLLIADAYGAATVRPAPEAPMNASRRRAQILRFALVASARLGRRADPRLR